MIWASLEFALKLVLAGRDAGQPRTAHCARRGIPSQFSIWSHIEHVETAATPLTANQPFYQRSAFFLSVTDRSCPSSSLWKAGGGGHLIKSSETKLLRHLHPPSLCPCSAQPQSSFKRKYILSVPPQSPDSYGEQSVKYYGGSKNILWTSMLRHWNKQSQIKR